MLFQNKIKKVLNIENAEKKRSISEPLELEKGDIKAMLIAAAITIGPFVIGLIGLIFLSAWLFGAFG